MDNECSKYPEIAEGNGIQCSGVRAERVETSLNIIVWKEKKLRPDTV